MLRRWESIAGNLVLTTEFKFKRANVSSVSPSSNRSDERANARNVRFFTLYGGQFKFSEPKQFHFENQNEKADLFSFYSPSVATIRRIFNLFTNSHKSPAMTNTSNKADDKIRAAWNIEPSISNNPVVLSTASGIEDSWRKQLITFNQNVNNATNTSKI